MGNSKYIAGKNLTTLPVYNGKDLKDATPVMVAIVKKIKARKRFTSGTAFVVEITNSIAPKFPEMTRNAIQLTIYRALARYFS